MPFSSPARRLVLRRLWQQVAAALVVGCAVGLWWNFGTKLTTSPAQALGNGQQLLEAQRVLVVVAHPDDAEWYIGGTLRLLANNGAQVRVMVASNGEGGPNRSNAVNLALTRRSEQRTAAAVNGYSQLDLLGLPDRDVARNPRLVLAVARAYQQFQPQAVLLFDPQLPSLPYLHSDHQGSAAVVQRYWQTLGTGKAALYLFQTRRPNAAVNISAVIGTKGRALAQHISQNGGKAGGMLRFFAQQGRLLNVDYAETFRVIK